MALRSCRDGSVCQNRLIRGRNMLTVIKNQLHLGPSHGRKPKTRCWIAILLPVSPTCANRIINAEHIVVPAMPCCGFRSEEHTSELQSRGHLVCRLLLEKKNRANQSR